MPSFHVNLPSPWYLPFENPPSYLFPFWKVRKPLPWYLPPSNIPSQLLPSQHCRCPCPQKTLFLNSPWYQNQFVLSVPLRRYPCSYSPQNSCCWLNSLPLPWYLPSKNSPRQYSSSPLISIPQPLALSNEKSPKQTKPCLYSSPQPVLLRFLSSPPRKIPPSLISQDCSISALCYLRNCSMDETNPGSRQARTSRFSSYSRWLQQLKTAPICTRIINGNRSASMIKNRQNTIQPVKGKSIMQGSYLAQNGLH